MDGAVAASMDGLAAVLNTLPHPHLACIAQGSPLRKLRVVNTWCINGGRHSCGSQPGPRFGAIERTEVLESWISV